MSTLATKLAEYHQQVSKAIADAKPQPQSQHGQVLSATQLVVEVQQFLEELRLQRVSEAKELRRIRQQVVAKRWNELLRSSRQQPPREQDPSRQTER